ncbi:MAG: hypothetical protein HFH60_11870 [Lachnospiraceae bacterium]|nr:hypothetical protein [Lachnospiraceae bacterium]
MADMRRNGYSNRRASHGHGVKDAYIDGNTVRRIQTLPQEAPMKKQTVSRAARKNRERAQSMSKVFVVFLAAVSVAVLWTCVRFLQLKSRITSSIQTIAELETEYSQLKADNDAYESQMNVSVDLEQVKKTAMGRLGMKYPAENQIITYQLEKGSYVRQYQEVPDAE